MNKTIAMFAVVTLLGSIAATSLKGAAPSVSAYFAFESEYSFRGTKLGGPAIQPGVDVEMGDFYVGIWSSSPLNSGETNEIDFFGGYEFAVNETLTLDMGVTHYWYPNTADEATTEVYLGGALDAMLEPALYVFYDFDLKDLIFEGSVGHSIPLALGTSLDLGGFLGYYVADADPDWFYYGATADITYSIGEFTSFSAGVRYAGNSESMAPSNQLWWGASISMGF